MLAVHREHALSDLFVGYLLGRNIRYEEDLVDHLFNSSEKRLARVLLLIAHFGKEVNVWILLSSWYSSQSWLTFKQARELGGTCVKARVDFLLSIGSSELVMCRRRNHREAIRAVPLLHGVQRATVRRATNSARSARGKTTAGTTNRTVDEILSSAGRPHRTSGRKNARLS
jgi:hypothetical protein